MPIYYFGILFVFVIWLQYEIRKNSKHSKNKSEKFWQKERDANLIRKADISTLDYISIPYDALPMDDHDDATVNSYRDTILNLSHKKILNLTGLTNTELKMKYGTSNINELSEYDNNYTVLVSMLQKWGERLYSLGYLKEAKDVLEVALQFYTDVKKSYLLLSKIYIELGTTDKIDSLIELLPLTKITHKDLLADEILRIKNS